MWGVASAAAPLKCLCDQQRRMNIVPFRVVFHRLGVDDSFKTEVTFPAAPKMTNMLLIPILGPFGGNQLIVALGAVQPKGGTTFGYHCRHGNLSVLSLPPRRTNEYYDEPTVL